MKHEIVWQVYRPIETALTFMAHSFEHPEKVVLIKLVKNEWLFQVDENKFLLDLTFKEVGDLTILSEEEFFQKSVVWDSSLQIEYVRAVQIVAYRVIHDYMNSDFNSLQHSETVEY